MTKPTQAQIQAVRRMADEGPMECACDGNANFCTCSTIIQLCEAAAAGVGRDPDIVLEGTREGIALMCRAERNATIERCAQVAKAKARALGWAPWTGEVIEDAIRALKDKP